MRSQVALYMLCTCSGLGHLENQGQLHPLRRQCEAGRSRAGPRTPLRACREACGLPQCTRSMREPKPDSGCCLRPSAESSLSSLPDLRIRALEPGGRAVTVGPGEQGVTDFREAAWRGVGFQSQELAPSCRVFGWASFPVGPPGLCTCLRVVRLAPVVLCTGWSWRPAVPAALRRGRARALSSPGVCRPRPWAQLDGPALAASGPGPGDPRGGALTSPLHAKPRPSGRGAVPHGGFSKVPSAEMSRAP